MARIESTKAMTSNGYARRASEARGSGVGWAALGACVLAACSGGDAPDALEDVSPEALADRAYVISEQSNELFVVDLGTMRPVASVDTSVGAGPNANHMSMLSRDGSKVYVAATEQNALVVVDARTLEVVRSIEVGSHPTHAEACFACPPSGRDELWIVNEGADHGAEEAGEHGAGSISVIDMERDEVVRTLAHPSLVVPHMVRFSDRHAYIPSIGGNQITVVDLESFSVSDVLLLEGESAPGACSGDPCGFADAQIDQSGLLVAAHIETGRVLSYDTRAAARRPDLVGGSRPWSVFVDTLSDIFDTMLMPNWGDETVSLIDRRDTREVARSLQGDQESYGVNYSPVAPGEAFVLNRVKERVAVVDRQNGELIDSLEVGGTTETASTTRDGRFLLLPISSTNQFKVIDVATRSEVASFEDVGVYPWSVTTIGGQNYCH